MSHREVKLESHRQPTMVITPAQAAEYEAKHKRAYEYASGIVARARMDELYYPPTDDQVGVSAGNGFTPPAGDDSIEQDWRAARQRRQAQEQALLDDRRARVSPPIGAVALHP